MAEIGQLTERELIIAGAVTYWSEGGKNKPHRRDDRVSFINSDPGLVRFFLRFLEVAGVERELLIFRVCKVLGDGDYHGCLRIDVRRSASLYRKIEGWAAAAMAC